MFHHVRDVVSEYLQCYRDFLFRKQLDRILHLSGPSKSRVFLESLSVVAIYVLPGAIIAVLAFGTSLLYNSDRPKAIGGIALSTVALLLSLFVNAEASFVDFLERFTRRLMSSNERARLSAGFTDVNGLIVKWRVTGAIFRNTVKTASLIMFAMGVFLSWP